MCCFRRDIEDAVDTGLFQTVGINLWVTAKEASATAIAIEFAAAKAHEDELYLLFESWSLVNIIHGERPAAEKADV